MAIQVNLATTGFVGVTALTAGELSSANNAQTVAVNTVYALTGDTDFSVSLPSPNATDEFEGSVIIFKNLTTAGTTVIIGRQDSVLIDGQDADAETDVPGQVLSFYYINPTIGWLAGPAVL